MPPTSGGEDFAFMLERMPGAMIDIGNAPGPGPHHPAYDFNDDAIVRGSADWSEPVRLGLSP